MQPTRSTAVDLAEVQRVVSDIKKIADVKRLVDYRRWTDTITWVAAVEAERSARVATVRQLPPVATTGSLAQVMQCIKRAESGNYSESSHPGSGSGAYQMIPSTFSAWSARAGYSGYAYAYQAPPSVQDAIVAFMLTHGGAHNWDPAYGNDSCTVGFG